MMTNQTLTAIMDPPTSYMDESTRLDAILTAATAMNPNTLPSMTSKYKKRTYADPIQAEIRKKQNREAQRAFRERREKKMQELEGMVQALREENDILRSQCKEKGGGSGGGGGSSVVQVINTHDPLVVSLQTRIRMLETENDRLRGRVEECRKYHPQDDEVSVKEEESVESAVQASPLDAAAAATEGEFVGDATLPEYWNPTLKAAISGMSTNVDESPGMMNPSGWFMNSLNAYLLQQEDATMPLSVSGGAMPSETPAAAVPPTNSTLSLPSTDAAAPKMNKSLSARSSSHSSIGLPQAPPPQSSPPPSGCLSIIQSYQPPSTPPPDPTTDYTTYAAAYAISNLRGPMDPLYSYLRNPDFVRALFNPTVGDCYLPDPPHVVAQYSDPRLINIPCARMRANMSLMKDVYPLEDIFDVLQGSVCHGDPAVHTSWELPDEFYRRFPGLLDEGCRLRERLRTEVWRMRETLAVRQRQQDVRREGQQNNASQE